MPLRQSTGVTVKLGPMVDAGDLVTAEAGLTLHAAHIRLSKNGGAFGSKHDANDLTYDENGYYNCKLDATDTGTLGILTLAWTDPNAAPLRQDYDVYPADLYDRLWGATSLATILGTPIDIDGGGATIAANLTKIADDNDGADFDASRDSLHAIRSRGDNAWITGNAADASNTYTIDSIVRTVGDDDGGASADVNAADGTYFVTGEVATGTFLEVDAEFTISTDEDPISLDFWGYYAGGGGHYMIVKAYNFDDEMFEQIGTIGNGTTPLSLSFPLNPQHVDPNGLVDIKFVHSPGGGIIAHALYIDKLLLLTGHTSHLADTVDAIKEFIQEMFQTVAAPLYFFGKSKPNAATYYPKYGGEGQ